MEKELAELRSRIADAAHRAGRDPEDVCLVAVSKTHPAETIRQAVTAGIRVFGENRVQEAQRKAAELPLEDYDVELRLIGHLQSNKAKLVPGLFAWVESIDSLKIAQTLARQFAESGKRCNVLLQLNSSGEESKSGFGSSEELLAAAAEIAERSELTIRGVMTIGPFVEDSDQIRRAFSMTRDCFFRLQQDLDLPEIDTLSMGMSDDFELAIEEGSTEVRIGSAIFGSRGSYA